MVTQRVVPICPNGASSYHAGKVALDEMLAHFDEPPHAVEKTEAQDDDDGTATLGLAVNTQNYQALLENLAHRRRTSVAISSSPRYQHESITMCLPHQEKELKSPESDETVEADDDEEEVRDRTVVGLPVDTRNYEAIVSGNHPIRSDPGLNHLATVPDLVKLSEAPQSVPGIVGHNMEDDAVMGLPISTGNYVAYLVGQQVSGIQQAGHRNRGYSTLAHEKELHIDDSCGSSSRCGTSSPNSTPLNGNKRNDSCTSCFDTRRASNAAYVPYSSWVYIQHGAFKSWKRFYAVLSGLEFKFSKGAGHSLKGFGQLAAVRRMDALRYGLLLELGDGSTIQIRCPGEKEFEQWLDATEKAIERHQHQTSQSKTSYTLTATEQHDGYLFKQEKNKAWKRFFFIVRTDGYIECRDHEQGAADRKHSGYIKAVSFADCHSNGLAIQLSTDVSMVCYADSYDEQMLWYGAISAAAAANGKTAEAKTTVKSCYVEMAILNHAGWLFKQAGLFKGWKRLYFTLHGIELAYAKDTNSEILVCDKVQSVDEWEGHANGLLIRLISGRVWKIHADSYETAKRWRSVIRSACRHAETFSLKKYLTGRRRKKLRPVFGGWLTEVRKDFSLRRFFVVDGVILGVANDVDNQLCRLGNVVEVGSTRDLERGIVFTFSNGTTLKVNCDSLADSRYWYECLSFSIK